MYYTANFLQRARLIISNSSAMKKLNGKQIYNKRFKDGKEKISTYKLAHTLPLTQKFCAPKFKNSPTQDKPLMHQKTCLRYLQCTSICLCSLKTVHKHMLVHCNYLIHVFWCISGLSWVGLLSTKLKNSFPTIDLT